MTAAVVAPAAAIPPAVPAAAPPIPPNSISAPTETSLSFCISGFGSLILSLAISSNSGLLCIFSIVSAKALKLFIIFNSLHPSLSIILFVFFSSVSNLETFFSCRSFACFIESLASIILAAPCIPAPTPVTPATAATAPKINGNGIIYPSCFLNISQASSFSL